MKKLPVLIIFILLCTSTALANKFSDNFSDSTLRVDYILSGNSNATTIALSSRTATPGWAGRRGNLDCLPVRGDGQILVQDAVTGDTLYRNSFNTLYQEWLGEKESFTVTRSYECPLLIPMPKRAVTISVALLDASGDTIASLTHILDPTDILIRRPDSSKTNHHEYLHRGGNPADCIDIAILAEGYTTEDTSLFMEDARKAAEALLAAEPFASMADKINIVAVLSESKDSGVSVPGEGIWRDTAFSSHFNTFYSPRYLTTPHVFAVHDALLGIPYETIIILANTDVYGGGGIFNFYTLTTTHNPNFRQVVVHEFGHSFAALADEYAYDHPGAIDPDEAIDYEPWMQNVTSLVDFQSKWADMVDEAKGIGLYQGANYSPTLYYRPAEDCRMRTNAAQGFCPVCRRAIAAMIQFYTSRSL